MEAPKNANRITRDPEDPEGEGDTQYYTLPVHSESQTVARVKITETHVHKITLFSFRILSLVIVTVASASIPTSSACMPYVFNNPFLFLQCKLLHSHENHKPMSL